MSLPVLRVVMILLCVVSQSVIAAGDKKEKQAVTDQKIKLSTLQVIKNATQLIEDVGYPEKSRIKIYLSHGAGKYFSLQNISIVIDGLDKSAFKYNESQRKALLRGGSNRVYIGSLDEGLHELVVIFEGADRRQNIIKNARTWLFEKSKGENIIVINVSDNELTLRPDFEYKMIKGGK